MMPGIHAVTTCSNSGFNSYGRRMMQSWARCWPVPLLVYTEGFRAPVGINSRPIEHIDWLKAFQASPTVKGPTATYRHDAKRFAWKTAAVIDAALQLSANPANRFMIWVDADTFHHSAVPTSFVETLLPAGDEFLSWLWRDRSYPESGFVVYDLRHPLLADVMSLWRSLYTTGGIYELAEWHDAWILQWLMNQFPSLTPKSISGNASGHGHPYINGPLGQYSDHMKGNRKSAGRSGRGERRVRDQVAYWRR